MPEVILPCPACGAMENEGDKFALSYRLGVQVICHKCGMYGPVADGFHEAVQRWNVLPRALTWTHEPPVQNTWYLRRERASANSEWGFPKVTWVLAPEDISESQLIQWSNLPFVPPVEG